MMANGNGKLSAEDVEGLSLEQKLASFEGLYADVKEDVLKEFEALKTSEKMKLYGSLPLMLKAQTLTPVIEAWSAQGKELYARAFQLITEIGASYDECAVLIQLMAARDAKPTTEGLSKINSTLAKAILAGGG